jgi:hypothetical protein
MTEDEYNARAIPRLARIDALDKNCQWDKHSFEVDWQTLERRELRDRLMKEQNADEAAAGI